MKNITCFIFYIFLLLLLGSESVQAQLKDDRLFPVTEKSLQKLISETAPSSKTHASFISRSQISRLQEQTYKIYTQRWKKNQSDPYLNLWRGKAALSYWKYATHPKMNIMPIGSDEANALFQTVNDCLQKAVKAMPSSSLANAEYGFFLWQYLNQSKQGIANLKKAVELDPRSPLPYIYLGDIHCNPSSNLYDIEKAETYLTTAQRLDSQFAYIHWLLTRAYITSKQFTKAQKELDAYLALVPTSVAPLVKSFVEVYRQQISVGLQKH